MAARQGPERAGREGLGGERLSEFTKDGCQVLLLLGLQLSQPLGGIVTFGDVHLHAAATMCRQEQ